MQNTNHQNLVGFVRDIAKPHHATFEGIRQLDAGGHEYWSARKLAKVLEHSERRHFLPVVAKAREACRVSGYAPSDHIEDILDMVDIGSGTKREIEDIKLSRYACYPCAQGIEEEPEDSGSYGEQEHRTGGQPFPRHASQGEVETG